MNEHTKCILCDSNKTDHFINVLDRLSQKSKDYELVRCKCNFIYLNPRPDCKNISSYYRSSNYNPHNKFNNYIWSKIYKYIQSIALRWKYKKIYNFITRGKLLDIGGGNGEFAEYMFTQGWQVVMQDKISDISLENNSYKFVKNLNEINSKGSFDVITLWHSLEHIHNIDILFDRINYFLNPEGLLLIAVPNIEAPERKIFGKYWAPFDAPRHLYHFDPHTLKRLCAKYNFKILNKYSLYQDTPYNIILSFTKLTLINIIRAAFLSFISIIQILFRGPDYSSSLLVICKKN